MADTALKGITISESYDWLIFRETAFQSTGNRINLMNDSGVIQASNFYIDPTNDRIGIGIASPESALHIQSTVSQKPVLILENTNADNTPPYLKFIKDTSDNSEADDDYLGVISFHGDDDGDTMTEYARLVAYSADVTNGTEDGTFAIETMIAGSATPCLTIKEGKVGIGTTAPNFNLVVAEPTGPDIAMHRSDADNAITNGDQLGTIKFTGADPDTTQHIGAMIRAEAADAWGTDVNDKPAELHFFTQGSGGTNLMATPNMVINMNGYVGIGSDAPASHLHIVATVEGSGAGIELWADEGDDNADKWTVAANGSNNNIYWASYTGGSWDNVSRLTEAGELACEGGVTTGATDVDYAEYFETSDGKAIAKGTTVVLEGDKIRPTEDGESPFGVIRPSDGSAIIAGASDLRWQGQYLKDDFGSAIYEDYDYVNTYGKDRTGSRKKVNPDFDESREYIERSERDEWQVVGLVGQVQILKGQPVPSSWIKMKSISDTLDLYYIFPCAQVVK